MATRASQLPGHPDPVGRVQGELVVADGLSSSAPDFVARARELGDASEVGLFCQTAFDIGVAALRTIQMDSELRRASDLMEQFEASIEDATTRAVDSVHSEMDSIARPDDGLIAAAVTREMAKLSGALEVAFAKDDRRSVLSRIEEAITTAAGEVITNALSRMQRLVDPSADDSPMGRLVREIVREIKPGVEAVTRSVSDLRESLGISAAVATEREKGHEKGGSYEDLVGEALGSIALATGDAVEHVGDDARAGGGSKAGDHLVVVDRPAGPARIVFEAKDVGSMSSRKAKEELDEAADNRQASAAVMVLAGQTAATGGMPLVKLAAGRHAVVFDKTTRDDLALRVAYQQARHEALASPGADRAIDMHELGDRLTHARQILDQITEVKKGHGTISTGLEHATKHLDRLRQDLGTCLDEIVEFLGRQDGAE